MSKVIKGLFWISRPQNSLFSGLSVLIGAIASISGPLESTAFLQIFKGCLTTFLLAAGGYVINDIYDYDIDKINMPHRALPSGDISVQQAKIYSIILFIAGVLVALTIDIFAFVLALVGGTLLFLYAMILKRTGFIGNLTIGILVSIPFIFGGFVTQSYDTLIYPALFAGLLNLGREVIKDVEDVEGDRIKDVKSLALVWGIKPARNISLIILWITIGIVVPIPILTGIYKSPFFILLIIGIIGLILYGSYLLVIVAKSDDDIVANATHMKRLLKTSMTFGVIAFLIEGFTKLFSL